MNINITIIGLGYVGLVTGVCLAKLGHKVIGYDIDKNKIRKIKKGEVPFFEMGMRKELCSQRFSVSLKLEQALKNTEVVFICVGTPRKKDGSADMKAYWSVLKEIAKNCQKQNSFLVVNKSTVPVGTARLAQKFLHKRGLFKIQVLSCPEFLREGTAISDFLNPDRIVIGTDNKESGQILKQVFKKIKCPKIICNWESAELIKYASNAFLATKISFINEIANISEKVGADVEQVAKGVGLDQRIGAKFLKAGIGYGGSCFPKDIKALHQIAGFHKYNFKLLKAVIQVNNQQRELIFQKIKKELHTLKNKKIGVLGLAFKGNTDDIRESASVEIIKQLLKSGAQVKTYDPAAVENTKRFFALSFKKPQFKKSAYQAIEKTDLVFIATEWQEFVKLNWSRIGCLVNKKIIVDGKNLLSREKMEKLGFRYVGVGK